MGKVILNYSPTVMFCGTPCICILQFFISSHLFGWQYFRKWTGLFNKEGLNPNSSLDQGGGISLQFFFTFLKRFSILKQPV